MNTEDETPPEADASSDDDLVNIHSDLDVESLSDEEDAHSNNDDEDDGMFDIFSGQLRNGTQNRSSTLNSDAYHQELEREFGEGSRNAAILNLDPLDLNSEALTEEPVGLEDGLGLREGEVQAVRWPQVSTHRNRATRAPPLVVDTTHDIGTRVELPQRPIDQPAELELETPPTDLPLRPAINENTQTILLKDQTFTYPIPAASQETIHPSFAPFYTYKPLETPRTIRVLEILPAQNYADQITTRVHTLALPSTSSRPEIHYQAISYAWGTQHIGYRLPSDTILVDGARLRITSSLHRVLKMVRGHLDAGRLTIFGKRPCVWADAVCINQGDLKERSAQVGLMADVFSMASRSLFWLGDMEVGEEEALGKLVDGQGREDVEVDGKMLRDLIDRPWFHRRWTIQEFAMQSIRTILCGRLAIDFAPFRQVLQSFELDALAGPMSHTRLWDGSRTKRWLMVNLHRFRKAQCAVEHDLVYALINVSCGCSGPKASCGELNCGGIHFSVDYEKPIEELFLDLGTSFAKKDVGALLACAAVRNTCFDRNRPLPTWCPDWRVAPTHDSSELLGFMDECFDTWDVSKRASSFEYLDRYHFTQFLPGDPDDYPEAKWLDSGGEDESPGLKLQLSGWMFGWWNNDPHARPILRQVNPSSIEEDINFGPSEEETFRGEWPSIGIHHAFLMLPWCRIAYVLKLQRDNEYKLVSCFRRPIVLGIDNCYRANSHFPFSWTEKNNDVWLRGNLDKKMMTDVTIV